MTTVFADTSFYVALTSERDSLHPRAAEFLSTRTRLLRLLECGVEPPHSKGANELWPAA